MNKGWICPKCGKVYSPKVEECKSCNGTFKITPFPEPFPIQPYIPEPYVPYVPTPIIPTWPPAPWITWQTITTSLKA